MTIPDLPSLDKAARDALTFLREKSASHAILARKSLRSLLQEEEVSLDFYLETLRVIKSKTRIAIHLHPERLTRAGTTVVEGLLKVGKCLTQFETGISNGSPTGFTGGARDEWERSFFGGHYHQIDEGYSNRPKYGALMLASCPDGPAPRFGSSYLVLYPNVNKRSTYTFGGNQDDLAWERTGSWNYLDAIFLSVLKKLKVEGSVLGRHGLSTKEFLTLLKGETVGTSASWSLSNALDSYVEAQIHGPVSLKEDVEKIVVDRSLSGTGIETSLVKLAAEYDLELEWYDGYVAQLSKMPTEFRGYKIGTLMNRMADDGHLTAAKIGAASNAFHREPDRWARWRDSGEALTYFRRVWHALVYHGHANP